jgi:hypothetical protein
MLRIVILKVPPIFPELGLISLWLESEIIPGGKVIINTKIVIHTNSFDIYWFDNLGKIYKDIIILTI